VFRVILCQVEAYDNMILPVIDCLSFVTPLALDVLSYMLPAHISDISRHKLQDDGINVAHWFQHLACFTGSFFRAFPQTELRSLVDYLMLCMEVEHSLELLVINELLARMGGCEVLEDISDTQIVGLAGGENLRRDILALNKASKRAILKLQATLSTQRVTVPMLSLICQQSTSAKEYIHFKLYFLLSAGSVRLHFSRDE